MTNKQARDTINVLRQTIERINDENRNSMSIDISSVQNIINHWEETLDEVEVLRETTKGINQCPDGINTYAEIKVMNEDMSHRIAKALEILYDVDPYNPDMFKKVGLIKQVLLGIKVKKYDKREMV